MEVQKTIRWQLILLSCSAALLFTPTVKSQEITNTVFDDGPNVAAFSEPAPAQGVATAVPVQSTNPPVNEVATIQTPFSVERVSWLDSPVVAAGLTLLLLVCIGLSAISESKRSRRSNSSRRTYPSIRRA